MHTPNITCKNCGNHFHGRFCNECGEKVYGPKDKSMMHIVGEAFHFITHFDGSFLITVKTFLRHPGKMSADYAGGIRKKYFKPVSFFLLLVVAYFLFPRFPGLNMRLSTYVSRDYQYAWYASPIAKKKEEKYNISYSQLAQIYDKKSAVFAKFFLLVLIPLSATVLALIFFTSKRYFFDHFILASELMSFYVFSMYLFMPLLKVLFDNWLSPFAYFFDETRSFISLYFVLLMFIIFITVAFRNFYKQPLWLTSIKSLVFLFVFAVGIRYVYSLLLYFLVMLFV